jgi:Rap guanine nucleotide exchange factor 2
MVLGVVDKAETIVLDHNEKLDSWAVVLNGQVESILPDNTIKSYHVGDHFGVQATLDPVYNEGIMRTKCDDCQFVLVKQNDYYEILNQSKENTKSYFENNRLVMVTEYRLLNNTSDRQGEILLRATPDKLIERLVTDDSNSILDPTFIQDFLLTYRVFIETPTYISNRLSDFFDNSTKSPSLAVSTTPSSNIKKKVYRIVLEWITNHFNDFETNKDLYDFVEKFQDTLNKEKMNEQFRVLTIAISTKSKQRTVTLARSKRDESLMFNIQGGWDKGYGVFISKVDKDSKASELGIRKGDQIIEVNGHSFQHITLTSALETLKSFTHLSIVLKYNPIGFNEMLLHPEKSPHRNKKNFINSNKAYLIEYLQMQQQNHQQQAQQQQQQESLHNDSINSTTSISSPKFANSSNTLINHLQASNTSLSSTSQSNSINNKKTIGSIPPLPPSSINSSLTPRNKSKDKFKLLNSNSNLSNKESGGSTSNNQLKKILGRFNKKTHSKDLESLQHVDSSAPALKSITRSPSPSLSNFNSTTSFNNSKINNLTTSDYSSNLSRNNSSNNLANNNNQQLFDESLAKMSLQDQQQFAGEHVLKIYKNDQTFKYLVVHKETSTKEVVMLALNEFNIVDDIGSNAYSLCEVSVDHDRLIKQKRLPDQMNNLAEKLPLNARYYLRSNTSPEQFLNDPQSVEELIKDSNLSFLQLDPLELSAQLTLRDYCIFKSIESSEYIDYLFKKNSKFGFSHLNQFSDLSNEEMFWVINEILHESNLIKRARIIKHFIQIAQICKECKNFNSLFAILSGLDHMSVTRLKDTWDKVSNKYKKILQDLKQLLDPSFNMVKYRQLVKSESIQPPIIPFFPICQKDLYFIKEFGETQIDGMINFEKLRKLSKSVRSIVQMTASSFDLTSMRDVPTSHTVIFSMFGCTNPSLIEFRAGGGLGSGAYHQFTKLNIRADHVKKLYEESVMVRKVRHYLNSIFKNIERNEERLRLISSTLEHSTSGNTLKRKPSPNSSLGGSLSSINALNNSSNLHNISNGSSIGNGITAGNGTLGNQKSSIFGKFMI